MALGWFGAKKPTVAGEPGLNPERYRGKPLLRLLELYVLWALDRLSADNEMALRRLAPKLAELYGGDGTWQGALATTMELPVNMPELIRELWEKNQAIAAANDVELSPQHFAEMVVDTNLT